MYGEEEEVRGDGVSKNTFPNLIILICITCNCSENGDTNCTKRSVIIFQFRRTPLHDRIDPCANHRRGPQGTAEDDAKQG